MRMPENMQSSTFSAVRGHRCCEYAAPFTSAAIQKDEEPTEKESFERIA